jgi:hypothetical protein
MELGHGCGPALGWADPLGVKAPRMTTVKIATEI